MAASVQKDNAAAGESGEPIRGVGDAITDVEGVSVGHISLMDDDVQTGITVVIPTPNHIENALLFYGKYTDGDHAALTGFQVTEDFGLLSAPIFLTNLLSVGKIYNGALTNAFTRGSGLPTDGGWPPIIMGFDDRLLNNMNRRVLSEEHALEALVTAKTGPVTQGNVGAGVGAVSFGYKGGIGSASRSVRLEGKSFTVGSLVLANHGERKDLKDKSDSPSAENPFPSFLGVIATDAPLSSAALDSLASQAARGAEDCGSRRRPRGANTVVAFSTGHLVRGPDDGSKYKLFFQEADGVWELAQAAREATHAAIAKALSAAESLSGVDGKVVSNMPLSVIQTLDG
ncbi:MAG: D-aminopeptidase [Rhodothermales bacterium]